MKKFVKLEDFTQRKLWNLRKEISVNSLFVCDYENSYYISPNSLASFFDGYYDFMWEIAEEEHPQDKLTHDFVMQNYDNSAMLYRWYLCYDDFRWVNYQYDKKCA